MQIAACDWRCAVFVRNIDLALQRAEACYSQQVWQMLTAYERSAAIYRELRALDAQAVKDGSFMGAAPLRHPMSRA